MILKHVFFFIFSAEKYHGFLFKRGDDTKSMPIYDLNGYIAGVQTAVNICAFFLTLSPEDLYKI